MQGSVPPQLEGLLRSCCQATGLDGAGVSIETANGTRAPLYGTDDLADKIERLQLTLGEGPCVDSSTSGSPVLVPDLTDDGDKVAHRWPVFRQEATRLGTRAIFAFPLRFGAIGLGAVDLHRRSPGPLGAREMRSALLSVDAVGMAVISAPAQYAGPSAPATTNLVVYQAAGMVMAQLDTSIEEAMVRLRAAAFADGKTVNELAVEVVNRRRRLEEEE
jgi:GAF domain-containing protein/ANTAR domain-containing protein